MSGRIGQPVNQVRLTNVALVRLKRKGKRFEIACYKNKVVNWRNGAETDVDEVLQIANVFTNVSKGILAKNSDLMTAFKTIVQLDICKIILQAGELQVSDKERSVASERLYRDVATIVSDKCVNPQTNRPYPIGMVERLMKEMHYCPVPNKSAKQQALEAIKLLREGMIPIERAKMKVQIQCNAKDGKTLKAVLEKESDLSIVSCDWMPAFKMICLINPGMYRTVNEVVGTHTKGAGLFDVLELCVTQEGEFTIDEEYKDGETKDATGLETALAALAMKSAPSAVTGLSCTTCGDNGGTFGTDKQRHREHFRSDWHRYNLKLKAKAQETIDEDVFDKISSQHIDTFFQELL